MVDPSRRTGFDYHSKEAVRDSRVALSLTGAQPFPVIWGEGSNEPTHKQEQGSGPKWLIQDDEEKKSTYL